MPELVSRWIAGAEAVTIGAFAVIAWVFQVMFLGTIGLSQAEPLRDTLMLINLALVTAGLFTTLWLLWVLVVSGSTRLRQQPLWLWVPALLAALLIVVGRATGSISSAASGFSLASAYSVFGAPLFVLIPLAHLVGERFLRSNNSLQRP